MASLTQELDWLSLHFDLSFRSDADRLPAMQKPLRCLLLFYEWRLMTNDEGQQYKTCTRCGAYRDFAPRAGAS